MASVRKRISLDDVFNFSFSNGPSEYWLFPRKSKNLTDYSDYKRGVRKPPGPMGFDIKYGRMFTDILGNSSLLVVASERLVKLWRECGFTGWTPFPVRIFDRQRKRCQVKYYGIAINGRCGRLDFKKSAADSYLGEDGQRILVRYKGIYFNPRNWGGSDFFMLGDDDPSLILVTRRVIDAMKAHEMTGWTATPVKKYKT